MKVIVSGGRDWEDKDFVYKALDLIHDLISITFLVEGEARGVDTLAYMWRKDRDIPGKRYKANWKQYGKAAGGIRNEEMLTCEKPDVVILFPGGVGTGNMKNQSAQQGVKYIEISKDGILKDYHGVLS